ncbi:MAG: tRNA pseudouridine(38-40) synthase TruA [Proteobacteria bacterium]|nr:tRNA pseudouridine(38-40) synthase TruA [Pseudomonadota bacterium]
MTDERVLKLVFEYDGAPFAGWQVQPAQRTVQGDVEAALLTLMGTETRVECSGRTDAGVHAAAQVASLRTTSELSCDRIQRGINGLVPSGVSCLSVQEMEADFHARFSATGKVYAYRVLARRAKSPLRAGRVWHVHQRLDRELLAAELATLTGTADWSAYRAADCGNADPVKTLRRAELEVESPDVLVMRFEGSGFLKQMVRTLAGTAIDVARGRYEPGAMVRIREGRDRKEAGRTAPACGLTLEQVLY